MQQYLHLPERSKHRNFFSLYDGKVTENKRFSAVGRLWVVGAWCDCVTAAAAAMPVLHSFAAIMIRFSLNFFSFLLLFLSFYSSFVCNARDSHAMISPFAPTAKSNRQYSMCVVFLIFDCDSNDVYGRVRSHTTMWMPAIIANGILFLPINNPFCSCVAVSQVYLVRCSFCVLCVCVRAACCYRCCCCCWW